MSTLDVHVGDPQSRAKLARGIVYSAPEASLDLVHLCQEHQLDGGIRHGQSDGMYMIGINKIQSSSVFRPSPLSIGSPRTSPFRRPDSPSQARPTTPSASPTKSQTVWTPRGLPQVNRLDGASSPTASGQAAPVWKGGSPVKDDANTLSKLSQAQLRELREVFQVLDRDSSQSIRPEDVAEMLSSLGKGYTHSGYKADSLGQNASPADVDAFFPSQGPRSISLPQFLNMMSNLLSALSSPQELTAAFAAFDEDDSGQINAAALREAVINTAPEGEGRSLSEHEVDKVMAGFLGRRTFGNKKMGRDETFRYQEFVTTVSGSSTNKDDSEKQV